MECLVHGVSRQALIDSGAQVTVISEELFNCLATNSEILQPHRSPVLGANNLPLDIVGEAKVVLEIGDIKAPHRVYVCRGFRTTSSWE